MSYAKRVKTQGRVEWETRPSISGEFRFGIISLAAGEESLLISRLKLWDIVLNEFSRISIGVSNEGGQISGDPLLVIEGADPVSSVELAFPAPAEFVVIEAHVVENQNGAAGCSFAILV